MVNANDRIISNTSVAELAQTISAVKLAQPISVAELANPRYLDIVTPVSEPSNPVPPPPPPLPPDPLLPSLVLDTPNITFNNGVPVGGNAHLSLFPDGSYSFTGHFHDSGATSYDTSFVYVVKDKLDNSVFTFTHTGRTHGTFESGSRNDDWNDYGTNPALAADWGNISIGYNWSSRTGADINVGGLFDEAVKLVGYAQTVIQVVGYIAG